MIAPRWISALLTFFAAASAGLCGEAPKQSDFYTITRFEAPEGHSVETAGIAILPGNQVAVCTRRGQIWTIDNAFTHPAQPAQWKIFAEYLHEPLSLAWENGWLYAVQRPEVTRLKDEDGDGRADLFETVSDEWGISGNYHEYNFGTPRFDKEGNLWCALCLTGSFTSEAMFRGWILKINQNGKMTPAASGIRSPGGIGFNAEGDVFYTDNQGAWNGSSSLKWVKPGSFQGNPNGNIWFEHAKGAIGQAPPHPDYEIEDRMEAARKKIPALTPPAVVMPHIRVGNSPTGIETDLSGGKFGPFAGQMFVGEQTHSKVHRVFLEKVKGIYQGAIFPFLEGFDSGNIGLLITADGTMFTGGSNRGWGAKGGKAYSFERVNWNGKVPFEIHEMRLRSDGFELTFTEPIDPASAKDSAFSMEAFTYVYAKKYGSDEVDKMTPKVSVTSVAPDHRSLRLAVDPLTKGHVHALKAPGLRSAGGGFPLLHSEAYYTINEIPAPAEKDDEGFQSIFNGKDLTGWDGIAEAWKVEDGAIVCAGRNEKQKNWLIWKSGEPGDFTLKLEFKFQSGNSGVQIRSHVVKDLPPYHVRGYQVEIAQSEKMGLWHHSLAPERYRSHLALAGQHGFISESGEKTVKEIGDGEALKKTCRDGEWNELEIIARGPLIIQKINGQVFSKLTDHDKKHAMSKGLIALQDHGRGTVASFRNIRLKTN